MKPVEAVRRIARELDDARVPSPRTDAEHLVAHVLGATRTEIYATDRDLAEGERRRLGMLVERRRAREPLAYVLGTWGFRRLDLAVDRRVLVPRPETEVVVERCLVHLSDLPEPRVLDVGVGSGAIALAVADEHPGARVTAVDRSPGALAVARANLARANVDGRVRLVHGDLLGDVAGPFDLVVSNPPYVDPEEYERLEPEVRLWEPRDAVVGVGIAEAVADGARAVLRAGGRLVLECGAGQAPGLAAELGRLGYDDVVTTLDLAGHARVVDARWS